MFNVLLDLDEAKSLLRTAAELLGEVRTGEDFECVCHEHEEKIMEFLKEKDEEV